MRESRRRNKKGKNRRPQQRQSERQRGGENNSGDVTEEVGGRYSSLESHDDREAGAGQQVGGHPRKAAARRKTYKGGRRHPPPSYGESTLGVKSGRTLHFQSSGVIGKVSQSRITMLKEKSEISSKRAVPNCGITEERKKKRGMETRPPPKPLNVEVHSATGLSS